MDLTTNNYNVSFTGEFSSGFNFVISNVDENLDTSTMRDTMSLAFDATVGVMAY